MLPERHEEGLIRLEGLLVILIFYPRDGQGHDNRRLRFINKMRAGIHFAPGSGVKLGFPRGDQTQAMPYVIHGIIRQGVAMPGTCIGILGDAGQYLPHGPQDSFFLGECAVVHEDHRLVSDRVVYCDTTDVLRQAGALIPLYTG